MTPLRPAVLALAMALSGCATAAPPSPSAASSPRAVVEAKFDAVNRHALAEIVALYAPDADVTASDFCAPRHGRADVERTYAAIFAFAPDASVEVQEMISEGDRVAVRFTVRSRAPGRGFEVPILDFFTVRDGLIVRDDGRFDNHGRPCTP